jgi:hypothetical protein
MSLINLDTHSRGGLDVTLAINLFFKGVLLFPIFLFAIYVGVGMMKHMIFHGVPVMNAPTEDQQQILRNRDASIGMPKPESDTTDYDALPPRPVLEAPAAIDPSAIELLNPASAYSLQKRDDGSTYMSYQQKEFIRQNCDLVYSRQEQRSIYECNFN